jgi:YidC/Oxa1 family membrane protein insertase
LKSFRIFRASVVALILCLSLFGGAALAQIPNPKNDGAFTNAKRLETDAPMEAMESYFKVKNNQSRENKELAAEALVRAIQFGIKTLEPQPSAASGDLARVQREEIQSIVGDRAHEASKQLLMEFPTTQAAKFAADANLKQQLDSLLDKRNSHLPTYKIIDSLVAVTGRIPAFSYWFALLFIALAVKTITFPLTLKMYKSQREMQRVAPMMKELQEKYKGKPEMNQKVMEFYKEHGVNPFASCLPMLVQLPFLWWVYNMIRLYEFHFQNGKFAWIGSSLSAQNPAIFGTSLGAFDLILTAIYALSNYLTMKLTPPSDPSMAQQQKTMSIMMTAMMFYFFLVYKWASAFTFYWLCLNFISTYQQYKYIYLPNKAGKTGDAEIILPPDTKSSGNGSGGTRTGGTSSTTTKNGTVRTTPLTPVPNDAMRARPRRKPKK